MTAAKATQPDPLAKLREPFPAHQVSKLPKPTKAQTDAVREDFKRGIRCQVCGSWHHPDVVHLDYVGHAALTDRLLDVDPAWSWEPMALRDGLPAFDQTGGLWIKLTVCGVTRLGYGHAAAKNGQDAGAREKEVIGDALRNAGMRFGAALDLWHKGDLHVSDDAARNDDTPRQDQRWAAPSDRAPGEPTPSVTACQAQMNIIETEGELRAWPDKQKAFIQKLDEDEHAQVVAYWKARMDVLRAKPAPPADAQIPLTEAVIDACANRVELDRWAADNKAALDAMEDGPYKALLAHWKARYAALAPRAVA